VLTSKCEQLLGVQRSPAEPGRAAPASPAEEGLGDAEVQGCMQTTHQDRLKSLLFWVTRTISDSGLLQSFGPYIHIFLVLDFSVFKIWLRQIEETFKKDFPAIGGGTHLPLANAYA